MAGHGYFREAGGWEADMRRTAAYREATMRLAEPVVEIAKGLAPVDTGAYRDSIHAEPDADGKARVVASDPKAAFIEFGTGEPGPTKKYAVLRTALRRARLRIGTHR